MKTASINEIKQELVHLAPDRITQLCLRLARFKKENKELLSFLLFEEQDMLGYIKNVKKEMEDQFEVINTSNVFFAKKTLRKVLRTKNKYVRYSGDPIVELELGIYFCTLFNILGPSIFNNAVVKNIYKNQFKKLNTVLTSLHEDLQYDYKKEINLLIPAL